MLACNRLFLDIYCLLCMLNLMLPHIIIHMGTFYVLSLLYIQFCTKHWDLSFGYKCYGSTPIFPFSLLTCPQFPCHLPTCFCHVPLNHRTYPRLHCTHMHYPICPCPCLVPHGCAEASYYVPLAHSSMTHFPPLALYAFPFDILPDPHSCFRYITFHLY
jgi:hypothetical protein